MINERRVEPLTQKVHFLLMKDSVERIAGTLTDFERKTLNGEAMNRVFNESYQFGNEGLEEEDVYD